MPSTYKTLMAWGNEHFLSMPLQLGLRGSSRLGVALGQLDLMSDSVPHSGFHLKGSSYPREVFLTLMTKVPEIQWEHVRPLKA